MTYVEIYKEIQGGSQLRDIAKIRDLHKIKGNELYITVPHVKAMSSISG